ncbi:MAG: acetylxylan esterase, partial [Victivallales bacterium]|nr:acetylxylan esterase [Victivallales bacterium]
MITNYKLQRSLFMKSNWVLLFAFVFAFPLLALEYVVETDHLDALYKIGEKATFTVQVKEKDGSIPQKGTVEVTLDNMGPKEFENKKWNLKDGNTFQISGTLSEPGFLRLTLGPKDKKMRVWSAGFEPEKIQKGSPSPKDFDEFWANAIEKMDQTVPEDMQQELVPEYSEGPFNYYRISFATVNHLRVYGFLSVPKDASEKKKYPVSVTVPAAGPGSYSNTMKGSTWQIKMFIAVYPYAPPFDLKEHKQKFDEMSKECKEKYGTDYYPVAGINMSREDYFFYAPLLGINRAVNWLAR